MAGQRGWVSVRDQDDEWRMLSLYDDGWCAAPLEAPTADDTRRRLRTLIGWMVLLVGLFTAAAAAAALVPGSPWLSSVPLLAALGALGWLGLGARRRARRRAPVFGSSAEHAAAVTDVVRVPLGSVRSVALHRQGHEDVVEVALRRGGDLAYRSPDRTLGRLFTPWSPAPPSN